MGTKNIFNPLLFTFDVYFMLTMKQKMAMMLKCSVIVDA